MKTVWRWIRDHWKTAASIGCTAVGVGLVPINPAITAVVGGVCTVVLAHKDAAAKKK